MRLQEAERLVREPVVIGCRGKANSRSKMQNFSRNRLESWARLALFAILAVFASPTLAFACCCAQEPAWFHSFVEAPAPATALTSHAGCAGHPTSAAASAQTANASYTSGERATAVAPARTSQPYFRGYCGCEHAKYSALAVVPPQHSQSFSALVLGMAVQPFADSLAARPSIRFAFATNAARPRSPDHAPRLGRAPPAFGL